MDRTQDVNATPDKKFREASGGNAATRVRAVWLNDKQEELCGFVEGEGLTLDPNDQTQLRQALDRRFPRWRDAVTKEETIAALRALTGSVDGQAVRITTTSRSGLFRFDSSDLSAEVAADTESGVYVAPDSDNTGASGSWVRQYGQAASVNPQIKPQWFGADGGADDSVAIQACWDFAPEGTQVWMGDQEEYLSDNLVLPNTVGFQLKGRTTIKAISGITDSYYLCASFKHINNVAEAQTPIVIDDGIVFDGDSNVTHPLILQNWNSDIDVETKNGLGAGFVLSAETRAGTTFPSSSMVNNRIKIRTHNNQGRGIWVKDSDRNNATDGYILPGSYSYSNGDYGADIDAGAGWDIHLNTYANGGGINVASGGKGTRIHDSYIDDGFGIDLALLTISSGLPSDFTNGETVTGGTSGATGKVCKRADDTGILYLFDVSGTFSVSETVTGGSSAATATVDAQTDSLPESGLARSGAVIIANVITAGPGEIPVYGNWLSGPIIITGNGNTAPYAVKSSNNNFYTASGSGRTGYMLIIGTSAGALVFSENDAFETDDPYRWDSNLATNYVVKGARFSSGTRTVNGVIEYAKRNRLELFEDANVYGNAYGKSEKFNNAGPGAAFSVDLDIPLLPNSDTRQGILTIYSRQNENGTLRTAYVGQVGVRSKTNGTNAIVVTLTDILVTGGEWTTPPAISIVDDGAGRATITVTGEPSGANSYGSVAIITV